MGRKHIAKRQHRTRSWRRRSEPIEKAVDIRRGVACAVYHLIESIEFVIAKSEIIPQ